MLSLVLKSIGLNYVRLNGTGNESLVESGATSLASPLLQMQKLIESASTSPPPPPPPPPVPPALPRAQLTPKETTYRGPCKPTAEACTNKLSIFISKALQRARDVNLL